MTQTIQYQNSYHPSTTRSTTTTLDDNAYSSQSLSQVPDLMPSDTWMLHSQHTPRATHPFGHHRESSTSSVGSNGPASPYTANTSNPHIAVGDAANDGFQDVNAADSNYSYHIGKPLPNSALYANALANFTGHNNGGGSSSSNNINNSHAGGAPTAAAATDYPLADAPLASSARYQKIRGDRGIGADMSSLGGASSSTTRSHPVSVASSLTGGDSPATPLLHDLEDEGQRRRKNVYHNSNHTGDTLPPKLDRTLTDVYTDELYNPSFTVTSASPPTQTMALSPSNELFAQRLQAANSQHLSAVHSPTSSGSRDKSPFRQDSPFASTMSDFSQMGMNQVRLGSAQQMREQRKAEQDARELQQQLARSNAQQNGTPTTISPKDAVLEFPDSDDVSNAPLFPPNEAGSFNLDSLTNGVSVPQQMGHHLGQQQFPVTTTAPVASNFNFPVPSAVQIPQQYPFVARHQPAQQAPATAAPFAGVGPLNGTTNSDVHDTGVIQRPARTNADGGTYTCTYHGCTRRFETPALLQKHKREGHRQAHTLNNIRPTSMTQQASNSIDLSNPNSMLNSQAGPHKCERINPSTGKPCNTIFSRPYDLTRHEDTIHNARKQKVRCNLCTEEKTFSRADALTRHYRVCHPDVEFPGKHRRRGGSSV
jgi:hypothetical protein